MNDSTRMRPGAVLMAGLRALPDREIHLITGVLQGLAAYVLVENGEWLSERLHIAMPLWLLVLVWPSVFLLSFTRENLMRAFAFVSGFSLLLALLALYTGWQATPGEDYDSELLAVSFSISMCVAVFVALIQLQPRISKTSATYEVFFTLSWRNFLTVGFSWALMLGVRLVLFLWESLFAAVGIDFFTDLFARGWFIGPVLGAAFAFGLYSFRSATSVIDSVASLLMRLTWLLLPILMLLVASFLGTLPFVGLKPLWDTSHGTSILMAANLLGLFFVNAVYQTGDRLPYAPWPHKALMLGIALLPVVSAIACYGLLLRVGQYGWTVARLWAMLVVLLMACFSIGYAYAIFRNRIDWHQKLPDTNRHMSWAVLGALLLTASPLLDFRAMSAWSQFSRVESGAAEALDLKYVRERLGRPGHARLKALEARDPTFLQRMESAQHLVRGWTRQEQSGILKRPRSFDIPKPLSMAIKAHNESPPQVLVQVHLDDDEVHEYVAIWIPEKSHFAEAACWTLSSDEWLRCGRANLADVDREAFLAAMHTSEVAAAIPERPYKDVRLGEHLIEFR